MTNVDSETLSLSLSPNAALEVETSATPVNEDDKRKIDDLKTENIKKDVAFTALQSKCDLLSASFDQVTKKVEIIE